jgi:hypothetical protein
MYHGPLLSVPRITESLSISRIPSRREPTPSGLIWLDHAFTAQKKASFLEKYRSLVGLTPMMIALPRDRLPMVKLVLFSVYIET